MGRRRRVRVRLAGRRRGRTVPGRDGCRLPAAVRLHVPLHQVKDMRELVLAFQVLALHDVCDGRLEFGVRSAVLGEFFGVCSAVL